MQRIYLKPLRNARGIIGPVPLSEFEKYREGRFKLVVLTNTTYDGVSKCLCVTCTDALYRLFGCRVRHFTFRSEFLRFQFSVLRFCFRF